jgi:hypothetical protein
LKPKLKTGSIKYPLDSPNPLLGLLPEIFWQQMIIDQNRHRGSLYEKIALAIVLNTLDEDVDASKLTILQDKQCFLCFKDNVKKRRYDIYIKELQLAFEVKSHRVILNKFTKAQIQKDKWLLENKRLKEIRWLLFDGASKNTLQALSQGKVIYIDINGDESTFTNLLDVLPKV